MKLKNYEKGILDAFKNKQFEIIPMSKKVKATYQDAARATLHKNRVITIRMNGFDLDMLKEIAIKAGKKYQTYIGELLHDHVNKRSKAA